MDRLDRLPTAVLRVVLAALEPNELVAIAQISTFGRDIEREEHGSRQHAAGQGSLWHALVQKSTLVQQQLAGGGALLSMLPTWKAAFRGCMKKAWEGRANSSQIFL